MLRFLQPKDPEVEANREYLSKILMSQHPDLMELSLDELEQTYQHYQDIFEKLTAADTAYDTILLRLDELHRVYIRRWAKTYNARVEIENLLINYPEEGPSIVRLTAPKALKLSNHFEKVAGLHAKRHAVAYRSLANRLLSLGVV